MTRSGAGNRFRTRKLSTKQSLAVLRENQIDSVDDDAQRNIPQIETGVERGEEIEHHLQAAISASQAAAVGAKVTQIFIPTPNTTEITVTNYETLYPKRFSQPASYIRFSSTVEDCSGIGYCMSAEDEKFFEKMNATKRPGGQQCKVEEFERIMDLFESIALEKQPYMSIDMSTVMPYDEMVAHFGDVLSGELVKIAAVIYSHWKEQRVARGGSSIIPTLKFEQGQDKDDGDPYVCFRRREVRPARKTRRTDAQSTEKLKKLRQEFDSARNLVRDVLNRECMRKTIFQVEYGIFESRRQIIGVKRKNGIRGDDEDLINHKPKKRPVDQSVSSTIRVPIRHDGKPPEAELRQLVAVKAEKEKQRADKFQALKSSRRVPKHGFVDLTDKAFSDSTVVPKGPDTNFCGVQTYYLPSPPPSCEGNGTGLFDLPEERSGLAPIPVLQVSSKSPPSRDVPAFRRRRGRGGRIIVDRRGHGFPRDNDLDDIILDRMKHSEEDEDYSPVFVRSSNSDSHIQYRARMLSPPPDPPVNPAQHMRRQVMPSPGGMQSGTPATFLAAATAQQVMGFTGYKLSQHPGQQQPQQSQQQQPSASILPLANRAPVHTQVRR
ncbi:enhancer of polycomb-like-domain-containing protein [Tuber indicum]|nr:enhancer of polycomb-like-domain-containing protein [Tuber indicum]